MKNLPSLSIIIPSYNQGRYIERTILSILKQDYPGELEVIVSDGGSQDETVDILKKYPQIKWWSEPDKGFVDAVTKGFAAATGEIIAIQSSDDFYLKDALKISVEELVSDSEVAIVAGCDIQLKPDLKTISIKSPLKSHYVTPSSLLKNAVISQHCAFFHRYIFDKIGGLREDIDTCADIDLWYRALHFFKAKFIPFHTAVYQLHSNQRTKVLDTWASSLGKMVELCEQDPFYNSYFKFSEQEKKDLYAIWEIRFSFKDTSDKLYKEKYRKKIKSILKSEEYTDSAKDKIRYLGIYFGYLKRDSYIKRIYNSLLEGSLIHKLNKKLSPSRLPVQQNSESTEININWWK